MSSEFSFQQRSVSLAIAGKILDAAVAYAGETDRAMVVAVVD